MDLLTRQLCASLESLTVGQRFWFWLCPDADVPLLLSPLADDPDATWLRYDARSIPRPDDSRPTIGVGDVDDRGRLSLASPRLSRDALADLADWVRGRVLDHPALGRLCDARLVKTSRSLSAKGTHEDPALWQGIPRHHILGTPEASAAVLAGLAVHDSAWFYACMDDQRLMVLSAPTDRGGDISVMKDLVYTALLRKAPQKRTLLGVAIRRSRGQIMLRTRDPEPQVVLDAIRAAHPALEAFQQIKLRPNNDQDFSIEAIQLGTMRPGDTLWFCLARDGDGDVRLALAADRDGLRARAEALGLQDVVARGTLGFHPRGWAELRTRKPAPDLLPVLAAWSEANFHKWPMSRTLLRARHLVVDEDGAVVSRHRDDALWTVA